MMKICFKCKQSKPRRDFYRHPQMGDGLLGKCKACTCADRHEYYIKNTDKVAAYSRAKARTPEGKKKAFEWQRKRRRRDPIAYRARTAVSNALRDRRLFRKPCKVCGERAQAHHEDYSKPLEVVWLCREHHLAHHGKKAWK